MSCRVVVFGASGQVGSALQRTAPAWATLIPHDSRTDIRERDAVACAIKDSGADVVINCAAFTRVDDAEAEPDQARMTNAIAPALMAEFARSVGARFIHLSTDYVFDGTAHTPYALDAATSPINVYGATKLEGERRVLDMMADGVVVRTAWVHSGGGTNFIRTAVRLLTAGTPMRVVDDQIGTPTRAAHLAEGLWHIIERPELRGLLHFTDAGVASWFDVATTVLETLAQAKRLGNNASVATARTEDFPRPARRPHFSVLDKHGSWKAIGYVPPHWRDGVIASTMELLHA